MAFHSLASPALYQEVQSVSPPLEPRQAFGIVLTCKIWYVQEKWHQVTLRLGHKRQYSVCLALFLGILTLGTLPPWFEEAQVTQRCTWRGAEAELPANSQQPCEWVVSEVNPPVPCWSLSPDIRYNIKKPSLLTPDPAVELWRKQMIAVVFNHSTQG